MSRNLADEVHRQIIRGSVTKDPQTAVRIAKWWLEALPRAAKKSGVNPETGQLSRSIAGMLRQDSKADQEGLRRFHIFGNGNAEMMLYDWSDVHHMERDLLARVIGDSLTHLGVNRHLGRVIEKAYQELLEFADEHEQRNAYLSKLLYGSNAASWRSGKSLRHPALAKIDFYAQMYHNTGKSLYSSHVEELWAMWVKDMREIPLPDGRIGWAGPHGINSMRSNPIDTWANSVYQGDTAPQLLVMALFGNTPVTFEHVERMQNLYAHTLMRYGWDGRKTGKIASDVGGGGSSLPREKRRIVQFTDDSSVLASFYIGGTKDGVPDFDSFVSVQRGFVFVGAAYTDIPWLENRIKLIADSSKSQFGAAKLALFLYEARRQGRLPGRA